MSQNELNVPKSSQSGNVQGAPDAITGPHNNGREVHTDLVSHRVPRDEPNPGLDLADPRTRLMIEKMLTALSQENAASAEKHGSHFSLPDYTAVLMRRWFPMLLVFIATLFLVAWRLKPGVPVYSATTTMMLPPVARQVGDDPLKTGLSTLSVGNTAATRIALVTSPELVERALQRLDAPLKQRGWGSAEVKHVQVNAVAPVSPDLIDVTVTAQDQEAAITLANTLVDVYGQWVKDMTRDSYNDSIKMLAQQKVQAEKLLLAAKNDLQAYKKSTGVLEIQTQLTSSAATLQDLEKEAMAARQEASSGAAVQSDATANDLEQKVAAARTRYESALRDFLPDAPEARQARQELIAAQSLYSQRVASLRAAAQSRASAAEARLSQARSRAANLPTVEYKLSQLESRVKLLQTTYETLSDRYTSMNLARFDKVDTPTTLNRARKATSIGRTWAQALVAAMLCAIVLAVMVGLLLEQFDNTVHSTEQIESVLGLPVMGSLPLIHSVDRAAQILLFDHMQVQESGHGKAQQSLTDGADSKALAASRTPFDKQVVSVDQSQINSTSNKEESSRMLLEACRIVRSNLTYATVEAPLNSLLITSADSGEGKSFCANNLALVMALDGKKVILLDCDLRRPSQHTLAKLALSPGFTNVVVGAASLEEALRPTAVKNLSIFPAGAVPPNPPEFLGSMPSRQVIDELKELCDLLIIDSPPVLSLSDAQVLASMTDGVLMVVGAGGTPIRHIQRAQANVRHAGGRLLGVIFNKVGRHNDPYYGYQYDYPYRRTDETA
jgi:capsular exopolysaccharide synthesis family protein